MNVMRKTFGAWAVAIIFLLLVSSGGTAQPRSGVVIGVAEMAATPDPFATITVGAQPVYWTVFDALTVVDPDGVLRPALASAWKPVSPTVWDFTVRAHVSFSDGSTMTANDIKASFDHVLSPQTPSPLRARINTIADVTVVDPNTVRITTRDPWALLPRAISIIPIVPAKVLSGGTPDAVARTPIGTGAFQLVDFDRESIARFRARTDSWRGVPRSSELLMRVIPDPAGRVAALKTGEIDIGVDVPSDNVAELRAVGRTIITGRPGRVMQFPLTCRSPLQDVRVRQALNYAIDKDAIAKNIFTGFADVAQGQLVTQGAMGFDPRLHAYPYDPTRAKALLAQAGYGSGLPLKVAFSPGRYENDSSVMDAVTGYWNKVGVQVSLQNMEAAVETQVIVTGKIDNTVLTLFTFSPVMDLDFPAAFFLSNYAFQFGCKSAEYDRLYNTAKVELDPQKRAILLHQLAAYFREQAWTVALVEPLDIFGLKSTITGFRPWPGFVFWPDSIGR